MALVALGVETFGAQAWSVAVSLKCSVQGKEVKGAMIFGGEIGFDMGEGVYNACSALCVRRVKKDTQRQLPTT